MEEKGKNKIQEKMEIYFDESINSDNYKAEQTRERLNLRKNKIFNTLFAKRKETFVTKFNSPNEIDINQLQCDEDIKKDVEKYLKTSYDIKKWFKYIFSSNKNEIYVSLYLLKTYIELQILGLKEKQRMLSRNDTELIQKLVDNLLSDDLKISYNSCACLTNLTLFPINIEKRIYSQRNLEKILKFFDILEKNISSYTHLALLLFLNISTDDDTKLFLIKNNFFQRLFGFIKNILNNQIKFINDISELETIKYCVRIIQQLIMVCDLFDKNYIKLFVEFIPYLKIITSKYFVNIDNMAFNENECSYIISLWGFYVKYNDNYDNNEIIKEIIKDNFTKVLISFYKKLKDIKIKTLFVNIFCHFSRADDNCDKIIINDGILTLLNEEIEKYQYSNVNMLNYLIYCCSNFSLGSVGENRDLIQLGTIYKVMDITIFYIDDKLDEEIINLLISCLWCLSSNILGVDREMKKEIIIYKKSLIIKIFCKALKLEIKDFFKHKIIEKIILAINDLNVISEEVDEEKEKDYDIACISNALVEILNNIYNKYNLGKIINELIVDIIEFIKDKEKNNI